MGIHGICCSGAGAPQAHTELCRLRRAALAEGQPGDAGLVLTEPECKIVNCVSLHTCASVFSPSVFSPGHADDVD